MGNTPKSTTYHPILGPLQLLHSEQSAKPVYLKQYIYGDDYLLQEAKRKLKQRCSGHIIQICHTQCETRHEICSTTHTLKVYFQQFSHSLADELVRRLKSKNNFTEKQLLLFLKDTTASLIALQQSNIKNVPLNTGTILYCQLGVKVIDMFLGSEEGEWKGEGEGEGQKQKQGEGELKQGQKQKQGELKQEKQKQGEGEQQNQLKGKDKTDRKPRTYLSPQLLQFESSCSVKSDIFSLGMILLEMVTLDPLHGYYSRKSLDYDSLIHRVSKIGHSIQIKTLLAEMLEYDPQERIGLYKLQESVSVLLSETRISKSRSTKLLKDLIRSHSSDRRVSHSQRKQHEVVRGERGVSPRVQRGVSPVERVSPRVSGVSPASLASLASLVSPVSPISPRVSSRVVSPPPPSYLELNKCNSFSSSMRQSYRRKEQKYLKEPPSFDLTSTKQEIVNRSEKRIESTLCDLQVNQIHNDKETLKNLVRNRMGKTNRIQKQNCEPPPYNPFQKQSTVYTISITKPNQPLHSDHLSRRETFGKAFQPSIYPSIQPSLHQTSSLESGKQLKNPQYKLSQQSPISPKQTKAFDALYRTSKSIDSPLIQNESRVIERSQKCHYSKISLPTGQSYEGEVLYRDSTPIRQGNGILYDSDSAIIYSGAWKNDRYNGFGTIHKKGKQGQVNCNRLELKEWVRYEGQFTNGLMHGFGTLYFSEEKGDKFAGCLKNGVIDGYGCFYKRDGTMITGLWSDGVYQQF